MTRIVVALLATLASAAAAQSPGPFCPAGTALVTFSSGDPAGGAPRDSAVQRWDSRQVIDTTWRFDVAHRRWSRPYFQAVVGIGWNGETTAGGTTTAPDVGARGLSACIGAVLAMREPTLVLHGARGEVRVRVDLRDLRRFGDRGRDTMTNRPRR